MAVRGVTNDSVVDSCLTEVFAPARMESVIENVRTPAGQLAKDVAANVAAVCVTGAVGVVAPGAALVSLLTPPLSPSLPPPQPIMAIAENNAAQISCAFKITPRENVFLAHEEMVRRLATPADGKLHASIQGGGGRPSPVAVWAETKAVQGYGQPAGAQPPWRWRHSSCNSKLRQLVALNGVDCFTALLGSALYRCLAINCLRAIHGFDSAISVSR